LREKKHEQNALRRGRGRAESRRVARGGERVVGGEAPSRGGGPSQTPRVAREGKQLRQEAAEAAEGHEDREGASALQSQQRGQSCCLPAYCGPIQPQMWQGWSAGWEDPIL